ncbi:hypothetical protein Q765_13685 [Flavobacterium rivuli WB 3.3-2 = DSM 21788]|uniref:TerB family tellurite resistance protein n=1 Tax=Flavobacterium rivuli WB 3.3-2 = DSM 21788 TaxID=1121895 RepID=A0A0A2LZS2_9FLAO|nr:hypothetical protein [Flavobacterium rivuli]KGO85882.1 hypothetical protein Q765_13685 [Flavobacterium rivuli WB 3.3-2 = DSM 21788]
MKKLLIYCLLTGLLSGSLQAQNKQAKVLLEQIAALHIYIGYVQDGYSTVKNGLDVIGDFKRGELNLHAGYFSSLRMVNPAVKEYIKVAEIIALQAKILQSSNNTRNLLQQDADLFNGNELAYVGKVYDKLLEDCERILNDLEPVVTDGQLEMKDDERMERIDMLHANMTDNYIFCKRFGNSTKVLAVSRIKEEMDIQNARALRGIND